MIKKKLLVCITVSIFSLFSLFAMQLTLAQPNPDNSDNDAPNNNPPTQMTPQTAPDSWSPEQQRRHMMRRVEMMNRMHRSAIFPMWNLGLLQNKNLSKEEARTITMAALLMYNRKDLKVGDITSKTFKEREVYVIQIVDDKGNIVSMVLLDKDTGVIRPLPKHPEDQQPAQF